MISLGVRIIRAPVNPASITFPESLPVSARRDEIARALLAHPVIVVCGETGSGKTTQLPKIALTLGRGANGKLIGHTQPRRIAASSVATRIAAELNTPLGEVVGYKVRFTDRLARGASVKLMTDGILLAEIAARPDVARGTTPSIIDEAHERSAEHRLHPRTISQQLLPTATGPQGDRHVGDHRCTDRFAEALRSGHHPGTGHPR